MKQPNKTFALNGKAKCLCAKAPGSLKPWAQLVGKPWFRDVWSQLPAGMSSESCMFEKVHHQSVYAFLQNNPQHLKLFQEAMATGTELHVRDFLSAYNFSTLNSILDLGGGDGSLLRSLRGVYAHLELHLFDLPMVIAQVPVAALSGIQVHSGNFFTDELPLTEAIILKWIVHNWTDSEVVTLFKKCRQALPTTGKLLIFERIVPGQNAPSDSKLLDLNMMLMQGGRERSKDEFENLLNAAGFILSHIYTTSTSMCVIEGQVREH